MTTLGNNLNKFHIKSLKNLYYSIFTNNCSPTVMQVKFQDGSGEHPKIIQLYTGIVIVYESQFLTT